MSMTKPLVARGRTLGGRGPAVCVPLVSRSRDALLTEARTAVAAGPDMLEWRVDYFTDVSNIESVIAVLGDLREAGGDLPLVATLRSEREGGQTTGLSATASIALVDTICRSGVADFVDVELGTPPADRRRLIDAAHDAGTQVIGSFHDFHATPAEADILGKFGEAAAAGADVAKIAVMPATPEDVLTLLQATLKARQTINIPLISMAMGPLGALSRVLGWVFGSSVTFAAGQGPSAPGQLPVAELKRALEMTRGALDPD